MREVVVITSEDTRMAPVDACARRTSGPGKSSPRQMARHRVVMRT
jgi:hypothetical protein